MRIQIKISEEAKRMLEDNIAKHGYYFQVSKVIEELSELKEVISRYITNPHLINNEEKRTAFLFNLIDEVADVYIMLEQLKMIFKLKITKRIKFKLKRQKERNGND